MNINKKMISSATILLIFGLCVYYFSIPVSALVSNTPSNFKGNVESFNIIGESTEVLFNAKKIHFVTNETEFYSIKNITIENNKGETKLINQSHFVKIQSNNNIYNSISIDNSYITLLFFNLPMSLDYNFNRIDISGYMYSNDFKPNGGKVTIQNGDVEYILIENEKITDFRRISFEMDNSSSIRFLSDTIVLYAFGVSNLIIEGKKISKISLSQGDGILRIDHHLFDIKNPDELVIEVIPTAQSFFRVDGSKLIFNGIINSAKLNNEDIILNDFFYWFKIQPEKINALSSTINAVVAVVLVFLTAFNVHSTHKLVSLEAEKKNLEKQKFLNILLAELETNKSLIDDSRKFFNRLDQMDVFDFIGFKEDGFNAFRNQGGFQYITSELYTKIAWYYNSLNRISKKITPEFIGLTNEEFNSEITLIENLNNELINEIEKERCKQ